MPFYGNNYVSASEEILWTGRFVKDEQVDRVVLTSKKIIRYAKKSVTLMPLRAIREIDCRRQDKTGVCVTILADNELYLKLFFENDDELFKQFLQILSEKLD